MTVDVSGSMEALDLSPKVSDLSRASTRLDVVKELFAKFVCARPDDLIGLVTFGGYASTRSPLTADHEALLHVLKGVQVPAMSFDANGNIVDRDETMTAVGDGLATALARLKNAETKSRIVILLSDGVSNTGAVEPDAAAAAAAKLGIRVYTIGVGTQTSRTPFRARDIFGRTTVQYANMSFDESQLKSIAKKTGARYFGVRDAKGLSTALAEIDQLEKTSLDRTVFQRYREFFPPFLLSGVLLILAAVSVQMSASRRLV
jgi:Ca-activated chloride channel family protein